MKARFIVETRAPAPRNKLFNMFGAKGFTDATVEANDGLREKDRYGMPSAVSFEFEGGEAEVDRRTSEVLVAVANSLGGRAQGHLNIGIGKGAKLCDRLVRIRLFDAAENPLPRVTITKLRQGKGFFLECFSQAENRSGGFINSYFTEGSELVHAVRNLSDSHEIGEVWFDVKIDLIHSVIFVRDGVPTREMLPIQEENGISIMFYPKPTPGVESSGFRPAAPAVFSVEEMDQQIRDNLLMQTEVEGGLVEAFFDPQLTGDRLPGMANVVRTQGGGVAWEDFRLRP